MAHLLLAAAALLAAPAAAAAELSFRDCTAAAGLWATPDHEQPPHIVHSMTSGGSVADFNNDGWQDIFYVSGGSAPDALYYNNGDGTFSERAAAAGVARLHRGYGSAVGDYDGDGWVDLFVASAGDDESRTTLPGYHLLYRNNGDGTFSEVADGAGVNVLARIDLGYESTVYGLGPTFGDYDLDGDLDLYIAAFSHGASAAALFRNQGDGSFRNVTDSSGVVGGMSRGLSPRFSDMDGDGYPELLLAADYGTSRYYRNNGNGTFSDWTVPSGTGLDGNGMGSAVGDFNNDGLLDWYVTSIYTEAVDAVTPGTGNMLYVNRGGHRFEERSATAGVKDGGWGWAAAAVDLDHNGYLDIVETNGWWEPNVNFEREWLHERSYLYRNNGDLTFTEVSRASGFEHRLQGRGLVTLDHDADGDRDILIFNNEGGMSLFCNDLAGPGRNWLRIFLDTGTAPDLAPNGYGSLVSVRTADLVQYRYLDGGSNYLGSSELSAHFGLGAAPRAEEVRVRWANGEVTLLRALPTNQTITIASP